MAYHIEIHKDNVEPYLEDAERISPAVREILKRHLSDLAEHSDFYLTDDYRIPGSPYCGFDVILRDPDTGKLRGFYFTISDEHARFGVLRVVFLDEKT